MWACTHIFIDTGFFFYFSNQFNARKILTGHPSKVAKGCEKWMCRPMDTLNVAAVYYMPEHFRKQSSYRPNLEEQDKIKRCSFYFQALCVLWLTLT